MVVNKKKLEVKVAPEFSAMFKKSDTLSSKRCSLKSTYRRERKICQTFSTRTKEEILGN